MQNLAILLSGFSIFSAFILALTHFRATYYPENAQSRFWGTMLVLLLASLQLFHYLYLEHGYPFIHSGLYHLMLFAIAPAFYLFSKPLLKGKIRNNPVELLHVLPLLPAYWLPDSIAFPMAFLVGTSYLLWLANGIYSLRSQRSRFHLEISFLGIAILLAVAVVIMVIGMPGLEEKLFFSLYTCAIGCAFLVTTLAINLAPQLPEKISEAATEAYSTSTLTNVDCSQVLRRLESLMSETKIYTNPELNLATLSANVDLSTHQLSELINTQLGKSFSRYIREKRVEAAKELLLTEASASVLSIGLSVGFTSQSNFYDAFREITGMTPGKYRKLACNNMPD